MSLSWRRCRRPQDNMPMSCAFAPRIRCSPILWSLACSSGCSALGVALNGSKHQRAERRQCHDQRAGLAGPGLRSSLSNYSGPVITAAIEAGIGIEQLAVASALGHAHAIAIARYRSEIKDYHEVAILRAAQVAQSRSRSVITVDP